MYLAPTRKACELDLSPRTVELYTAGPLSLKGPPGTTPWIPGLQPVPCGLSPLKAATQPGQTTARVRRCALMNIINEEKECAMIICCFDSWRMLMQCCKQFNLGTEETPELLQQHERDIEGYRHRLQENECQLVQLLRDGKTAAQQPTSLKEPSSSDPGPLPKPTICKEEPACGLHVMGKLLDEAEQEMEGTKFHEELVSRLINRVENLELEKALLKEELAQV